MRYRELGRTGLEVSEIGFGAEWMEKKSAAEVKAVADACAASGINILDCWMAEPEVRSNLGAAIAGNRDRWIIQGHIGSTWQNGQYTRTRDLAFVRPAFEDLLARLGTDHVELGMIHYVDDVDEYEAIMAGEFIGYVRALKEAGTIGHIGLSTHAPEVARRAALSGEIEVVMFSVNPAFDLLPAHASLDDAFTFDYADELGGMDPARAELYALCEREGVGLTVMKGYAGGRLFSAEASPFGVAMTPTQCVHYALTRPAVASILAGFATPSHVADACAYEQATNEERDYASVLAGAPKHAYFGQCTYCGQPLHALSLGHRHRPGEQVLRPGHDARRGPRQRARPLRGPRRSGRRLHRLPVVRAPLPLRRAYRRAHGEGRCAVRVAAPARQPVPGWNRPPGDGLPHAATARASKFYAPASPSAARRSAASSMQASAFRARG